MWVKSVNLYYCFLAFVDVERPVNQLRSAMVCAFLSAIYDYETDWQPIASADDSAFLQLLNRYVGNTDAAKKASELFLTDLNGKLSKDGLERGSGAFRFYCSVIGSKWLAKYSNAELDEFGRLLQQIDDLLDFVNDQKYGDINCFLVEQRGEFINQAKAFLQSGFYLELVNRSSVYTLVRWRCSHVCHKLSNTLPTIKQIINVHRPPTTLYAGLTVFAGFNMTTGMNNWLIVIVAVVFALITANIMVFNDLVEREHDRKKDKNFCYEYTWSVMSTFTLGVAIISVLLLVVAYADTVASLFIGGVWLIGLLYSLRFVRKLYVAQNLIVAACSASPILCGAIHARTMTPSVSLIFCSLTAMVLMREFLKDIEDVSSDNGYKETLPTRKGVMITVFTMLMLAYVPATLLVFSPIKSVRMTAYGLALVESLAGLSLLHPDRCRFIKYSIDFVLCCILLAILIA
ncbi:MAG: UbiA family prenyltransferase [Candidatus Staskawiczbacteria bacterium]|nr:UbiA family prenyltransferase [Candidatus Staskawiczbacteria bacterium]